MPRSMRIDDLDGVHVGHGEFLGPAATVPRAKAVVVGAAGIGGASPGRARQHREKCSSTDLTGQRKTQTPPMHNDAPVGHDGAAGDHPPTLCFPGTRPWGTLPTCTDAIWL